MRGKHVAVALADSTGPTLPPRIFQWVARRAENLAVAGAAAGGAVVGG